MVNIIGGICSVITILLTTACSAGTYPTANDVNITSTDASPIDVKRTLGSAICESNNRPAHRLVYVPLPYTNTAGTTGRDVEMIYNDRSAILVAGWLARRDDIARSATAAYVSHNRLGDRELLSAAIKSLIALRQEILKQKITIKSKLYLDEPLPIRVEVDDLVLQLAYMAYDIDGDARQFRTYVEPIILASDQTDRRYSFLENATPTQPALRDRLLSSNLAMIRAVLLYRLIRNDDTGESNTFKYLVERQASSADGDSLWPYDPKSLSDKIRNGKWAADEIFLSKSVYSKEVGCSNLLMVYVDWLDLKRRAATRAKRANELKEIRMYAMRLRRVADRTAFGLRAWQTLLSIIEQTGGQN